jgi:citrate lyase beta subunit
VRYEIQIETPQAVLVMPDIVRAAGPRCLGLHFGTYDYTAGLGISAANQSLDHPAADHAKAVMQVAAAQTGLIISDGSTNVLPVGDTGAVRAAWALHAGLVRRALERGIYQGWDLHPAQLPTRFAATYAFFRDGVPAAGARLRAYLDRASTGIADEPATARALSGFLLQALDCGAVTEVAGFTAAELRAVSDP